MGPRFAELSHWRDAMRALRFVGLLTIVLSTMALSQSSPVPPINQSTRVVSPTNGSQAWIFDQHGTLPLSFDLRRPPSSPWSEHKGAFPRNIRRAGMRAANSASGAIFLTAPIYGSGADGEYSVAVADLNGDGKLDLVVANYCVSSDCATGGYVGVLLGNGDGTFQTAVTYGSGGYEAGFVAVGA